MMIDWIRPNSFPPSWMGSQTGTSWSLPSTTHHRPVLAGVNALRFAPTRSAGFGVDTGSAPGDLAFIDGSPVTVSLPISITAGASSIVTHPEKRRAPSRIKVNSGPREPSHAGQL